jgi:hypothetical protein
VVGGARIPDEPPRPHTIQIDSCYLRPVLLRHDEDEDLFAVSLRLFYHATAGPAPTVSIPVLGEVMLTIARDFRDGRLDQNQTLGVMGRLLGLVRDGRLLLCGTGDHTEGRDATRIAGELQSDDPLLETVDVLALSAAFACADCEVFYTNDSKILTSRVVRERADEHDVKVRDAP